MRTAPAVPPPFETLTEALTASARTSCGLSFVGVDEDEQQVPMADIHARATTIAADLAARGIRRGDRVALVLPTCPEFVECFFGVMCAGAIPVPLYPPVRLGKIDEYHHRTAAMLRAVDAAMVITNQRIRRLLGIAVQTSGPRLGCLTATELGGADATLVEPAPDDIALIQFSSGTTHDPKPVALTHTNLLYNLAAIGHYFAEDGLADIIGVTWLPMYHDMGLIGNLLSAFYHPVPLTLLPPELFATRPAAWLRAISRHRATISAAPNFAFGLCHSRIRDEELDGVDLSSWRLCLNGAEAVNADMQRRFAERFARWGFAASSLTPCYGMAEASLAVTFKPARTSFTTLGVAADSLATTGVVEPGRKELVSVGRPLAGVEVEIRDDDAQPLPEDRVGRIVMRSPSVMSGYFGRPDLTDQTFHDGWLDTGDLGFVHDGELFVCGRRKDTIIIRGANHAPQDFEAALEGLPGVRTGCAVAVGFVPEGDEEEALALLVETTPDAPVSLVNDVATRVLERTGIAVTHVELLAPGTLPRTSSGKMRRSEARMLWQAGTLRPPARVSPVRLMLHAARGQLSHARATYSRLTASRRTVGIKGTAAGR
ncbi:fatty acyl-AMP ligase [Mycolicibacterium thermoresistibile]